MLCSFHSFKTCYAEVQIKRGGWGGLYQIPRCYEGLHSFSDIYSPSPALVGAPQCQADKKIKENQEHLTSIAEFAARSA